MKNKLFLQHQSVVALTALAVCCYLGAPASAQTIFSSASAQLDTDAITATAANPIFVGGYGADANNWAEYAFQLPNLGALANPFTAATLSLVVNGTQNNDSYGYQSSPLVGLTSGSSPLTRASGSILVSDISATSTTMDLAIGYTDQTALGTYTDSGASLLSYLNSAYNGGAGAGQYVFFEVQAGSGLVYYKGFYLDSSASLNIIAAPEPSLVSLLALGLIGFGFYFNFKWRSNQSRKCQLDGSTY